MLFFLLHILRDAGLKDDFAQVRLKKNVFQYMGPSKKTATSFSSLVDCKLLSNVKATDTRSYIVSEVLIILLASSVLSCEWNELHYMMRSIQTPEDQTPTWTAMTYTLIWSSISVTLSWKAFP